MSKQCDIVRDILPLYVDGACSEASAEMVKEHLNACADCNAIYQKLLSQHRTKMFFTKKAKALLCAMRQKKSREAEKR